MRASSVVNCQSTLQLEFRLIFTQEYRLDYPEILKARHWFRWVGKIEYYIKYGLEGITN